MRGTQTHSAPLHPAIEELGITIFLHVYHTIAEVISSVVYC